MYTVVSPWPPMRNGIADYAYELACHADHPLTVVTAALDPVLPPGPVSVIPESAAGAQKQLASGNNVFHFGNNPDHVSAVSLFLRHGGVAVVHDATLHYLAECVDLAMPGFFAALLRAELGDKTDQWTAVWRQPAFKRAIDYQELKLLSWLETARALIVHSRFAERMVGACLPTVPIHVIPHFAYPSNLSPSHRSAMRTEARRRLQLPPDNFVVTTLGFVTANKQYDAVLRAIAGFPPSQRRRMTYLVAGELRPHEYDLWTQVNAMGCADFVSLTGYLPASSMDDVLLASDLVCNLRYPSFGESSGSLARALGLGCAIVITDSGSYAELPGDVLFKVPAKPDPSGELAALLDRLLTDPAILAARRTAAYQYARTHLSPVRAATLYNAVANS